MNIRPLPTLAVLLILAGFFVSAPVLAANVISDAEAGKLYGQYCSACHGESGNGRSRASFALNPPPRDFSSPEAWQQLSRERMLVSVNYGRPGTAMVSFSERLTSTQMSAIVDYIREHFMHPPSRAQKSSGSALYREHCAVCHGDRGAGANWTRYSLNPAPRDFTSAAARTELSRERMLNSVSYGRPGTAMMSFSQRLSDKQVAAVVDYIRDTFMLSAGNPPVAAERAQSHTVQPAVAKPLAVRVDMSAPFPGQIVADIEAGRHFYMRNCITCHGPKGDGKGPRAGFISPPPRNFHGPGVRRRLNRPALFRAIAMGLPGTVMPAWSKVLDEQQIANVGEFVFSTFLHPELRPATADNKKKP